MAIVSLLAMLASPLAASAANQRKVPVVHPHGAVHPIHRPVRAAETQPLPLPPPLPAPEPGAPAPAAAAKPALAPTPAKPAEEPKPQGTGLPLPRFAALRTDDVNMRAGPGFRYPIEWVYKRRDLPVEIEREFEVWRLVLAPDGTRGWVHEATLTGRRTFMVQDKEAVLRSEPRDDAGAVARLMPGVIGRIRYCHKDSDWCRVQVAAYAGFLKRAQFWGALPNEVIPTP